VNAQQSGDAGQEAEAVNVEPDGSLRTDADQSGEPAGEAPEVTASPNADELLTSGQVEPDGSPGINEDRAAEAVQVSEESSDAEAAPDVAPLEPDASPRVNAQEPGDAGPEAEMAGVEPDGSPRTEAGQSGDPAGEAPEVTASLNAGELLGATGEPAAEEIPADEIHLRAMLEAIIYITEEPLTIDQIAAAIEQPKERVVRVLQALSEEYAKPERGVTIREVAGGFRMGTKPEHHEAIRTFVKKMKPPLKLSLAALETLAVIAYKQPITAPEIMEIRGVQGAGVLKTLLDRKLIVPSGRKQVVGKPILYKTTKDFLVQFGLRDLAELPTLKEFEELRRLAFNEPEDIPAPPPVTETVEAASPSGPEASPAAPEPEAVPQDPESTPQPQVENEPEQRAPGSE
jgi:segregation and condensation protein B